MTKHVVFVWRPRNQNSTGSAAQAKEQQKSLKKFVLRLIITYQQGIRLAKANDWSTSRAVVNDQRILAIIVAMIATMIYIALRFDYRFAISGAVLIHDPILILGIFSCFHLIFNNCVSRFAHSDWLPLNDTVVVYDRVRENFKNIVQNTSRSDGFIHNQTLSRTIMTSGLTLLVVIALFVYGGETVHNFSLALIIGIARSVLIHLFMLWVL